MNETFDCNDFPELGDDLLAGMRAPPLPRNAVLLDRDVHEWFEAHVPEFSRCINRVVRSYMEDVQRKMRQQER